MEIETAKAKESVTEKFKRLKFKDLEFKEDLITSGLTSIPNNKNIFKSIIIFSNRKSI